MLYLTREASPLNVRVPPAMLMSRSAKLLVTGDLHLGRAPSFVPPSEAGLRVEAVWEAVVALAIEQGVDALVLTGDIADQDNKLFEALGPIRAGIARLAEAGVPTVAVSGNHDYDVLHRLGGLVEDGFTLLGAVGTWEPFTLERDGEPLLRLVGWSFPASHVRSSPADTFPDLEDGLPTLAVVHGDLDVPGSPYAPLSRAALAGIRVDAWLLGHIHRPSFSTAGGAITLYPGSPQPLDPGEPGAHGPWIVTVHADRRIEAEQHALATVRYDAVEVDLSAAESGQDAEDLLVRAADEHALFVCDQQPACLTCVLDLVATGKTPAYADVADVAERLEGADLETGHPATRIRRVRLGVRPAVDLACIAETKRHTPAGAVAQLVLDVEAGSQEAEALVRDAVRALQGVDGAKAFAPLRRANRDREDPEAAARALLVSEGLRLLDALLAQATDDV